MGKWAQWLVQLRAQHCILSVIAVLLGTAFAAHDAHQSPELLVGALVLLTAVSLQILANVANDYGDRLSGVDSEAVLQTFRRGEGPPLSLPQLKRAMKQWAMLALLFGSALLAQGCSTPFSRAAYGLIGLCAILASLQYTLGRYPYGYYALGDLSVFLFFGITGVYGSYVLHRGQGSLPVLFIAVAVGLLIAGVLTLNNLRDRVHDLQRGKLTIPGLLGDRGGKRYYLALLIVALLFFLASLWGLGRCSYRHGIVLVFLPAFGLHGRRVSSADAQQLHQELAILIRLILFSSLVLGFSLVYCVGQPRETGGFKDIFPGSEKVSHR